MPVHELPLRGLPAASSGPAGARRMRRLGLPGESAARASAALAVAGGLTASLGAPALAASTAPDESAAPRVHAGGLTAPSGRSTSPDGRSSNGSNTADTSADSAASTSGQEATGMVEGATPTPERTAPVDPTLAPSEERTPGTGGEPSQAPSAPTATASTGAPAGPAHQAIPERATPQALAAPTTPSAPPSVPQAFATPSPAVSAPVAAAPNGAPASAAVAGADEEAVAAAVRVAWEQARSSGRPVVVVLAAPTAATGAGVPSVARADETPAPAATAPAAPHTTSPASTAPTAAAPYGSAATPADGRAEVPTAPSSPTPPVTALPPVSGAPSQAPAMPQPKAADEKPDQQRQTDEYARDAATAPTARPSEPTTGTLEGEASSPATRSAERAPERRTVRRAPDKKSVNSTSSTPATHRAVAVAAGLTGIDYVWGGTSTRGFDCSGYTQHVYRKLGVRLPRTAAQQQRFAKQVTRPRPGDLVFFGARAHHVGIYAGGGKMYDAPRTGRTTGLHRIWSSDVTYGRVGVGR